MSGALLMMMAAGSGAPGVVAIANETIVKTAGNASITYENDGTLTSIGEIGVSSPNWLTPQAATIAALYEIRASSASGDTGELTGTLDTWLALSSDRTWLLNAGDFSVTFTVEIRDKFTLVVRDSASVQLNTAT